VRISWGRHLDKNQIHIAPDEPESATLFFGADLARHRFVLNYQEDRLHAIVKAALVA
jgi:hypothetical protein